MDSNTQRHESHDIYDLTYGYIVGEGINVIHGHSGALLPPLSDTQVEDRDAEREEDDVDAGVDDESHLETIQSYKTKNMFAEMQERGGEN